MQTISQNPVIQGKHGVYNAVDIGPYPDPDYYAPEDGTVTVVDVVDDDSCGKRLKLRGATGEHGFCHNEAIYVKVGQEVKRGQKLARMGYTGYTEPDNVPAGTHVHWILSKNGQWVYPPSLVNESFIKQGDAMTAEDKAWISTELNKRDQRMDKIEKLINNLNNTLDTNLKAINKKLDGLANNIHNTDVRVDKLEKK